MTKAELIDSIKQDVASQGIEVTKKQTKAIVDSFLNQIVKTVAGGEEILLQPLGRFGSKKRAPRKASNMVTGEPILVPERFVPIFNASTELKNKTAELPVG